MFFPETTVRVHDDLFLPEGGHGASLGRAVDLGFASIYIEGTGVREDHSPGAYLARPRSLSNQVVARARRARANQGAQEP